MEKAEAEREADRILTALLQSGDSVLFEAARGPDGRIDTLRVARAATETRPELVALLMAGKI
jgi:hypothetical protein